MCSFMGNCQMDTVIANVFCGSLLVLNKHSDF